MGICDGPDVLHFSSVSLDCARQDNFVPASSAGTCQYLHTSTCSKLHAHQAHGAANICARVYIQGKHCLLMLQSADEARAAFEDAPNVSVVEMHINDAWARDWGPTVSLAICSSNSYYYLPFVPNREA